jgi:hypothetical protein
MSRVSRPRPAGQLSSVIPNVTRLWNTARNKAVCSEDRGERQSHSASPKGRCERRMLVDCRDGRHH